MLRARDGATVPIQAASTQTEGHTVEMTEECTNTASAEPEGQTVEMTEECTNLDSDETVEQEIL